MSYTENDKTFFTIEGVKAFTTLTNSGKLNVNTYVGQEKHVVEAAIASRRTMAIDAITTGLQQCEDGDDDYGNDGSSAQLHALQKQVRKLQAEKAAMQTENDKLKQRIIHDVRMIPINLNIQVTTSHSATGGDA